MRGSRRSLRVVAVLVLLGALPACGTTRSAEPKAARTADRIVFTSLAPDVYRPCGLSAARDAVWVLSCSGKAVKVAPGAERIARAIDGEIVGLDALSSDGSGSLWVTVATGSGTSRRGALVPLDATGAEPGPSIELGSSVPMHAVSVAGTTWVATIDGGLFAVNGDGARRVAGGPPLLWVVADGSTVWTVGENGDVVERTGDGAAARTNAGVLPNTIAAAAGEGSLWLAAESGLIRLDRSTGRATRVDVAGTVNNLEACGGEMWLSQPDFGVRSVDASGKTTRSVQLEAAPSYLACDGTTMWIVSENGRLASIDVTR